MHKKSIIAACGGFEFTQVEPRRWKVRIAPKDGDCVVIHVEISSARTKRIPPRLRRALAEVTAAAVEHASRTGTLAGDLSPMQMAIDIMNGEE